MSTKRSEVEKAFLAEVKNLAALEGVNVRYMSYRGGKWYVYTVDDSGLHECESETIGSAIRKLAKFCKK